MTTKKYDRDDFAGRLRAQLAKTLTKSQLLALMTKFVEGSQRGDPRYQYAYAEWLLGGVEPVVAANPKKGFRLLKQAAKAGVVEANFALGVCLRNGIGCEQDTKAALNQFHRASLLGSRDAMAELAKIYYRGTIAEKNPKLAKIFIDAANEVVSPIFYYGPEEYEAQLDFSREPRKTK